MLREIENEFLVQDLDNLIKTNPLTIVYFHANWCVPCESIGGVIKEYSDAYPEILILKIHVDRYTSITKPYNVKSVPTLLFFKQGELVANSTGATSGSILAEKIYDFIS